VRQPLGLGFLRGGAGPPSTEVKVAFIDAHKDEFGVQPICQALQDTDAEIAPNTYYPAKSRGLSGPHTLPLSRPSLPPRTRGKSTFGGRLPFAAFPVPRRPASVASAGCHFGCQRDLVLPRIRINFHAQRPIPATPTAISSGGTARCQLDAG
jgi:hypothetical protein